jgi:predicted dehydrogenase
MFRAALISGWHVHAHEYGVKIGEIDGAELACVWDDDAERGKSLAEKLNVPFEPSYEAILADSSIHGVMINTATNEHVKFITAAANAGKHIFTEKVLACTVAECREIKEAVDRANGQSGVRFCISLPHRTMPRNLFVKKVIEDNELGTVTYLRVRNAHGGAVQDWLPSRFYDNAEAGGGAMMDLGAHPMYLIRWLMGRPQSVASVYTEHMKKGTDDNCVSVFAYENGAVAVSETGFVSPFSPFLMEVYGTEGSLIVNNNEVTLFKEREREKGWITADLSGTAELPNALAQWVSGDIIFDYEAAEGLSEMMELAYAAYRSGAAVSF